MDVERFNKGRDLKEKIQKLESFIKSSKNKPLSEEIRFQLKSVFMAKNGKMHCFAHNSEMPSMSLLDEDQTVEICNLITQMITTNYQKTKEEFKSL